MGHENWRARSRISDIEEVTDIVRDQVGASLPRRRAALWIGVCGEGGRATRASLPCDIDAKERRRDIAETAHREPRSACAKIEIPASLSGEAWMTTTPRRRAISGLRHAKAAPGSKHHRPARQFRPRSNGTIP